LGIGSVGEFRAAFEESKRVINCGLILGDRPIRITMKRFKGQKGLKATIYFSGGNSTSSS